MKEHSTYSAYRFVKENRQKKRRHLNRLAFRLLFDKTTVIYLSAFGLMFSTWLGQQLITYAPIFQQFEDYLWSNYFAVILLGLLRPLTLSLTRPGVLFSSSDLFLTILPYSQKELWRYHALDKVRKIGITYLILGIVLALISPLSIALILSLVIGIWLVEVLMIIPQWLIYQQRWYLKWLIPQAGIILIMAMNLTSPFYDQVIFFIPLIPLTLLLVNYLGYSRLYKLTDWEAITEVNDRLLTKNLLISFASNVKIEPPKYRGFYHHVIRNKQLRRRFKEGKTYQIYDRLIFNKLIEKKEEIIKFISSLLLVILLLSIQSDVTYGWAIIINLLLYAEIGTSFYALIFEERLLYVLPWNLTEWKRAFSRWLFIGLIPLTILLVLPSLYWFQLIGNGQILLNLVSYVSIGSVLVLDRLQSRNSELRGDKFRFPFQYLITILVLIFGILYGIQSMIVSIMIIIYSVLRYTYNHIVNWERVKWT